VQGDSGDEGCWRGGEAVSSIEECVDVIPDVCLRRNPSEIVVGGSSSEAAGGREVDERCRLSSSVSKGAFEIIVEAFVRLVGSASSTGIRSSKSAAPFSSSAG